LDTVIRKRPPEEESPVVSIEGWTPLKRKRAEAGARHVDHEMWQLLRLHLEIRSPRFAVYPDVVQRAIRVAYAAHFRALMEFFHGSRPPSPGKKLYDKDIRFSDFLDPGKSTPGDPFDDWPEEESQRVFDADKLLAHLSVDREDRGGRPEWGCDGDLLMVGCKIVRLFGEVADAPSRFPRANGVLQEFFPVEERADCE
jgi:hypothetical protein